MHKRDDVIRRLREDLRCERVQREALQRTVADLHRRMAALDKSSGFRRREAPTP